jgi:hypothetical protein
MKRNQKNALLETAKINELVEASEAASYQLYEFIDFIQRHNPSVDRAKATRTAP